MTRATELTLQRDGLTLRATVHGREQDPLVILVHGFPDTPHSWNGVVPALVNAGYRVLVPWLRGYTAESVDRRARYGLLAAAEDIEAWREQVGAASAHLVGHDWGAAIAMTLNGKNPQGWTSLSLLAVPPLPGFPYFFSAASALPRQLRLSSYMLLMQSAWAEKMLSKNRAVYVLDIWRKWSPSWHFTENDFAPTRAAFSNPDIAWATTRYYRSLFSLKHADSRQGLRQLWSNLRVPVLALAGMDDGCMNIALHKRLTQHKGFPAGLHVARLPGCGHFLQAEQPQAVARELLQHFQHVESISS